MARVTIEKCLKNGINDKFDLVLIASKRANDLEKGKKPLVNDKAKNTLISLVEIEEDKLDINAIRDEIVKKYRKYGIAQNNVDQKGENEDHYNMIDAAHDHHTETDADDDEQDYEDDTSSNDNSNEDDETSLAPDDDDTNEP